MKCQQGRQGREAALLCNDSSVPDMDSTGGGVLTSQEHAAQTVGSASGSHVDATSLTCSRVAAAASVLLGVTLLVGLRELIPALVYVAVLALTVAALAISAGLLLWLRETLLTRVATGLASTVTLVIGLLHVAVGLPGTRAPGGVSLVDGALTLVLSGSVLALLALGASRRRPVQVPDHPYAL